MMLVDALFWLALAKLVVWMAEDASYAVRGKTSPRMQARRDAQAAGEPAGHGWRFLGAVGGYFADLAEDARADARAQRRRRQARAVGRRAVDGVLVDLDDDGHWYADCETCTWSSQRYRLEATAQDAARDHARDAHGPAAPTRPAAKASPAAVDDRDDQDAQGGQDEAPPQPWTPRVIPGGADGADETTSEPAVIPRNQPVEPSGRPGPVVSVDGQGDAWYAGCDCGWSSRRYPLEAMARAAGVDHIAAAHPGTPTVPAAAPAATGAVAAEVDPLDPQHNPYIGVYSADDYLNGEPGDTYERALRDHRALAALYAGECDDRRKRDQWLDAVAAVDVLERHLDGQPPQVRPGNPYEGRLDLADLRTGLHVPDDVRAQEHRMRAADYAAGDMTDPATADMYAYHVAAADALDDAHGAAWAARVTGESRTSETPAPGPAAVPAQRVRPSADEASEADPMTPAPSAPVDTNTNTKEDTPVNTDAAGPDEIRAAFTSSSVATTETAEELTASGAELHAAADRYETLQMAASTVALLREAADAYINAAAVLGSAGESLGSARSDFDARDGRVADTAEDVGNLADREVLAN